MWSDTATLQRQVIHGTKLGGQTKIESGQAPIVRSPHCQVISTRNASTATTPGDHFAPYGTIVWRRTDNFPHRYLVKTSLACCWGKTGICPMARSFRFEGQAHGVQLTKEGPKLPRLFPRNRRRPGMVPSAAECGVVGGVLPGIHRLIQGRRETVRLITGIRHHRWRLVRFAAL